MNERKMDYTSDMLPKAIGVRCTTELPVLLNEKDREKQNKIKCTLDELDRRQFMAP